MGVARGHVAEDGRGQLEERASEPVRRVLDLQLDAANAQGSQPPVAVLENDLDRPLGAGHPQVQEGDRPFLATRLHAMLLDPPLAAVLGKEPESQKRHRAHRRRPRGDEENDHEGDEEPDEEGLDVAALGQGDEELEPQHEHGQQREGGGGEDDVDGGQDRRAAAEVAHVLHRRLHEIPQLHGDGRSID